MRELAKLLHPNIVQFSACWLQEIENHVESVDPASPVHKANTKSKPAKLANLPLCGACQVSEGAALVSIDDSEPYNGSESEEDGDDETGGNGAEGDEGSVSGGGVFMSMSVSASRSESPKKMVETSRTSPKPKAAK